MRSTLLQQRAFSLRVWFITFAAIVCCAIIALFVTNTVHEHGIAVYVARREAENLAESLAQQASDTLEGGDGALSTLSKRLGSDGIRPNKRMRMYDTMTALVGTMPRIHNLIIADEKGRVFVSNFSATGVGWPAVTDRPYFRYHRGHHDLDVHISGPAQSRDNHAWVLFATRRLDRSDGTFTGVAIAPISLQYFEQTYARVDVGRSGSITLLAEDGTIMFRRPRTFIGRRMPDAGMFAAPYKSQPAGWFIRPSHVDGIRRLYAFRRLHKYPLIVQVALAESDYLADWGTATRTSAAVVAFIIVAVCGLAGVLGIQIGRRKRAEDTLSRLALLDGLTGLANRRQFDTMLEREWRRAARGGTALAVLMIDVDNFKSYNDIYGHQLGDKTLQTIAQTIAASVMRPSDLAARYGGEEFVVILPGTDLSSAMMVAERIRIAVVDLGLAHQGASNGVASVSIGVADIVPPRLGAGSALVEAADNALYDAKRAGRNRISVRPCEPASVAQPDPARAR